MEIWTKAVDVIGDVFFLGGLVLLIYNLGSIFTSLNSQNAEGKNHAGLGVAAGAGIMLMGKVLIPMLSTAINIPS